jgi:hypothetical protein
MYLRGKLPVNDATRFRLKSLISISDAVSTIGTPPLMEGDVPFLLFLTWNKPIIFTPSNPITSGFIFKPLRGD